MREPKTVFMSGLTIRDAICPLSQHGAHLDGAVRVKHHAAIGAKRCRGKVRTKLGTNQAILAVSAADFAPDYPKSGVLLLLLGAVHVGNLFTKIKLCILGRVHALDLHQGRGGILIPFAALEAGDYCS